MMYCANKDCTITNCIRNVTEQYRLQRAPIQVSPVWAIGCPFTLVGPVQIDKEDKDEKV